MPRAALVERSSARSPTGSLLLLLLVSCALTQACDCAGPSAPPGTSSYLCTCECGLFVLGNPVPDRTALTPRFEVCLTPDDMPESRPLFAGDVVDLCDRACMDTISGAVREVGCIDRPDLCAELACAEEICRAASDRPSDVFRPDPGDGGVLDIPDAALMAFGFAEDCRTDGPTRGLSSCEESACAMEEVRRVPVCGDGVLQAEEECDGICNTFMTCPALAPGTSGVVRCSEDCTYDLSGCVPPGSDAGPPPERGSCVARNEEALQARVLDLLRACTVIESSAVGSECRREASAPLCLTP